MKKLIIILVVLSSFLAAKADFLADTTTAACPGLITFTADDGESWVWDFGDGSEKGHTNPAMHPYTYPGVYSVSCKITYSNGVCTTFVRIGYIAITRNGSTVHVQEYMDIKAFPNPVQNTLFLSEKVDYQVADVTGRILVTGSGNQVDMQDLPEGIYFCIINRKLTLKIVKK